MAEVQTKLITEAELMAIGSDAWVEVTNGEVVTMTAVGVLHHIIAGNVYRLLDEHVRTNRLGLLFMDGLIYILATEGTGLRTARVPDVSFVKKESIPENWELERPFPGAPTLAVEVISPDDEVEDILKKVREYLDAGTEQVLVIFPKQKEVHQYRRSVSEVATYKETGVLDLSNLIKGLTVDLAQVFAIPDLK